MKKSDKKQKSPSFRMIHPADANLEPTRHKYHLQYKRWHWQSQWRNIQPGLTQLPKGHLRMLREDIYHVPEGFQGAGQNNVVIPSGVHTRFVLLGSIEREAYNPHHGSFTPEPATQPGRSKRKARAA